jgi:hypothetical protein
VGERIESAELPGGIYAEHDMPVVPPVAILAVPGCPVGLGLGNKVDGLWGSAANTTPVKGSRRQAPTVRDAMTFFMSYSC